MKTALTLIKNAKILDKEDFKIINELKEELKDVFLHSQIFRTRTEMEVSVLNDLSFPTPDAKYWQAVREQNVMFQELVMLSYDYQKNLIEIEQLKRKLKETTDDLERELIQIEINKKEFIAKNQERVAKDRIREIKEWHAIKERLKSEMEFSLEDVDEHQLLSYTRRFINQFVILSDKDGFDEKNNLVGQLKTALKVCKEKNLSEKLFSTYTEKQREIIEAKLGQVKLLQ